jgi:predicted secreted hydrolase
LEASRQSARSYGEIVAADGSLERVSAADFVAGNTLHARWMSTHSGASYPVLWSLQVPPAGLDLICQAWLQDREIVPERNSRPFYSRMIEVERFPPPGGDRGAGFVELVR